MSHKETKKETDHTALRLERLESRYNEYRHQWNLEKDIVRKAKWSIILKDLEANIRRLKDTSK